jgi:hypothetical protein
MVLVCRSGSEVADGDTRKLEMIIFALWIQLVDATRLRLRKQEERCE